MQGEVTNRPVQYNYLKHVYLQIGDLQNGKFTYNNESSCSKYVGGLQ